MSQNQPLRTRTFVWTVQKCPCGCGNTKKGWKPEGTDEAFYPGPGHLVAHDTIEHFGNKEGWDRELLAFGATMYGRMHVDEEMMEINASDFVGFLIQDQHFTVPPAKAQYYNKKLPKEAEQFLGQYMRCILKELSLRADPFMCMIQNVTPLSDPPEEDILKQTLLNAAAWFRRGWLLAQRLHHKHTGTEVSTLIKNLTNAVNNFTQVQHPRPGDRMTVSVDRLANTFSIKTA